MIARVSTPAFGLGTAIAAWSLSPLLIYESRGLADAPILALYAVTIGSALAWAGLWASGRIKAATTTSGAGQRTWLIEASLVGFAAFVAYPLLYFSAIQGGPPEAVNLVNYLWPVIAVIVVAVWRPANRSLETALAAGFGFAGAGLAIAAGVGVSSGVDDPVALPFFLAGMGSIAYGATSGAISIRHPADRRDSVSIFVGALLFGGIVAALILGSLLIFKPSLVRFDLGSGGLWALLVYAGLLPVAHLSWMNALRDQRLPAFSAAFLVPVISTAILAFVVAGLARAEVLSALVLVLCGVTFASMREKGVPVGYAVTLAFLASVQISQVLAGEISGEVNVETFSISELIAAIVAVFAGFVLSNAIGRYGDLQRACGRFYARAAALAGSEPGAELQRELDRLDALVLQGRREGSGGISDSSRFANEWADVELAVSNNVSAYEWLVLLVGGGGLLIALQAYAIDSVSAFTILLRALAVALIVGVLFAIRDYDHYRPRRLCVLLTTFRRTYGIPIEPGSPLASGVEYWTEEAPVQVRVGLAALAVLGVGAIILNA